MFYIKMLGKSKEILQDLILGKQTFSYMTLYSSYGMFLTI